MDVTAANELDVVRNNSDLAAKYSPALQRPVPSGAVI